MCAYIKIWKPKPEQFFFFFNNNYFYQETVLYSCTCTPTQNALLNVHPPTTEQRCFCIAAIFFQQ